MGNSSEQSVLTHPYVKLESVRDVDTGICRDGRGRETAAGRGYNAERLASVVLGPNRRYTRITSEPWYDNYIYRSEKPSLRVETKCCTYRYPSGGYGRFRIWKHHHDTLAEWANRLDASTNYFYFFVVYKILCGLEVEIGKLVASVAQVDEVLDTWNCRDHDTMGEARSRDISWRLLLKKLGVSRERFEDEPAIDITP